MKVVATLALLQLYISATGEFGSTRKTQVSVKTPLQSFFSFFSFQLISLQRKFRVMSQAKRPCQLHRVTSLYFRVTRQVK